MNETYHFYVFTKMFRDERTNKIYEPITLFDIQRLIDLGNESLIDKLPNLDFSKIKSSNCIVTVISSRFETILGRLNPNKIIDMTAIINARLMSPADFLWSEDIMGLRLVADGANQFKGRIKLVVIHLITTKRNFIKTSLSFCKY